jgi:hypothetical protein
VGYRSKLALDGDPATDGQTDRSLSTDTKGRLAGLLAAVLLAPIYFLVAHLTDENRGFVVFCVFGVFAAIFYVLRNKALKPRLLLPILALFAAQLSFAFLVPLPSKLSGFIMVSISTGDCAILIWLLSRFDRSLRNDDDEGPRYSA